MHLAALSLPTILMRLRSHTEITFIVCVLAVYGLVVWLKEKWRVHRTKNWPTANGTLNGLKMEKVDGGLNGVDYYKVSFHYTFTPQSEPGQECTGFYSFNCMSEEQANGAVAGLTGKTVCVHYQPRNGARSVLWEDEVWDVWFDTYRESNEGSAPSQA